MTSGARILVVDDEQHIVDVVVYVLEQDGFSVCVALDGDTGLRMFRSEHPDLVVLDLKLPGMSGLDLFKEMRRVRPEAPIIMLTSKKEEIDRVLGLELGADDYVTKPFSTRELVARVKAVLRRSGDHAPAEQILRGPLTIDRAAHSVILLGQRISLTRGEFRLLESLARYPARVFTREELVDRIYDGEHVVTDRSIDAIVKRVRKKLTAVGEAPDPIETVHGIGYKLSQDLGE